MHEHQHDWAAFRNLRSWYAGWGRGPGARDQRFPPCGPGFGMPQTDDMAGEGRQDFAFAPEEGDGGMPYMSRGWRGGPRGPWDRQGGGFGRGGGRSERLLEQGDLRWLVLDLIAVQPRHGYEIIKAIEEMMSGHYTPSPGVVYPTLTYLEETGLIASEAQATKKLYSITDEGRSTLEANAAAIQAVRARIEGARMRFGGPLAPEMGRAMDNLRAAIQVRLAKGEISPESLAIITAALDRAASEIERS